MTINTKPCFEFHYEMLFPAHWGKHELYGDGKDHVMRIVAPDLGAAFDALKEYCLSYCDDGGSCHYSSGRGQCGGVKVKQVSTVCDVHAVI